MSSLQERKCWIIITLYLTVTSRLVSGIKGNSVDPADYKASSVLPSRNICAATCTFSSDFCYWEISPGNGWQRIVECYFKFVFCFGKSEPFLSMNMADLKTNGTASLSSQQFDKNWTNGELTLHYVLNGSIGACELFVQVNTSRGLQQLWKTSESVESVKNVTVAVPTSELPFQIQIVGRKRAEEGCGSIFIFKTEIFFNSTPQLVSTTLSHSSHDDDDDVDDDDKEREGEEEEPSETTTSDLFASTQQQNDSVTSMDGILEGQGDAKGQTGNDGGLPTGSLVAIIVVSSFVVITIAVVIALCHRRHPKQETILSSCTQSISNGFYLRTGQPEPAGQGDSAITFTGEDKGGGSVNADTSDTHHLRAKVNDPKVENDYNHLNATGAQRQYRETNLDDFYDRTEISPEKTLLGSEEYAVPEKHPLSLLDDRRHSEKPTDSSVSGLTDYETVDIDEGGDKSTIITSSSSSDVYNMLNVKGPAEDKVDMNHYDHFSDPAGTGSEYSNLNQDVQVQTQQRGLASENYSHI